MRTPRQPSLFGVEASDPTPDDLVGLLVGPGELGRMGGTARVSVVVDAGWRVHALVDELTRRALPASWEAVAEDQADSHAEGASDTGTAAAGGAAVHAGYEVRTAYTTRLLPLADAWRDGPPAGLHLNGQALRLWVAAAGAPSPDGYLLALNTGGGEAEWSAVGAALAAAGVAGALLAPRGRGAAAPAYRITGRRRLARLAELVGDSPPAAPPDAWPSSA